MTELPRIDEHEILIEVSPEAVWRAVESFAGRRGAVPGAYARLVGCDPPRPGRCSPARTVPPTGCW